MISERVARDDDAHEHIGSFLVCRVGKRWGIYEDASYYSQTSGGVQKRGRMVRRFDPDARDLEGKPARFDTLDEAAAYARRWLIVSPAK